MRYKLLLFLSIVLIVSFVAARPEMAKSGYSLDNFEDDNVENGDDELDNDGFDDDSGLENEEGRQRERTMTKTRISRDNITFTPWQKRDESECLEGCKCNGAVMSCATENGREITITAGRSGNIITIIVDNSEVDTELEIMQEKIDGKNQTRLKAMMNNGQTREVRVMPSVASERALERLRLKVCSEENNCTIQLKEVGRYSEKDDDKELAYEVQAERHSKLLGLFSKKMQVRAQVSAENGEIIRTKKPWWAFLAVEKVE
jgi:hypothetical protein